MPNFSLRSIGITALVLFLLHGQLSAALPFLEPYQMPLAVLAAACSAVLILPIRHSLLSAIVGVIISGYFVLSAPQVSIATPYSDSKPTNLLLTLAFTILLPPILIRKRADLQRLLNTLGLIAMFITIIALFNGGISAQGRLTLGEEGNPIWLGRAAGLGILWITWRVLTSQAKLQWLIFLLPAIFVLIATGSRGPLLASGLGLIGLALTNKMKVSRPVAGIGLIFTAALIVGIVQLPLNDINQAFDRGDDLSAGRNTLLSTAWSFIQDTPQGLGVGGLDAWIGPRYPHNIIAEALAELGWLAGATLAITLIGVLWRYGNIARNSPEAALLFVLTVYTIMNSMVSGDLTSPKELYLLCSVSLLSPTLLNNSFTASNQKSRPTTD